MNATLLRNTLGLEAEAKAVEQAGARELESGARMADPGDSHATGEMGELIRQKTAG